VQIEIRWSEGNDVKARKYTDELIALVLDIQGGASSSKLLPLLPRRRGRWRRTRSSAIGCGGSVFSWLWPQMIPQGKPAS
jgi:hypothetical protein